MSAGPRSSVPRALPGHWAGMDLAGGSAFAGENTTSWGRVRRAQAFGTAVNGSRAHRSGPDRPGRQEQVGRRRQRPVGTSPGRVNGASEQIMKEAGGVQRNQARKMRSRPKDR